MAEEYLFPGVKRVGGGRGISTLRWCRSPNRVAQVEQYYAEGSPLLDYQGQWYDPKKWYDDVYDATYHLFGDDKTTNFFLMIVAICSPRQNTPKTVEMASGVFHAYNRGEDEATINRIMNLESRYLNFWRLLKREPLQGPKVVPFGKNLLGDPWPVTIDTWMIKCFLMLHEHTDKIINRVAKNLSDNMRMQNEIKRLAKVQGVLPCQYQAGAWAGIKMRQGSESEDPLDPPHHFIPYHFDIGQDVMAFEPGYKHPEYRTPKSFKDDIPFNNPDEATEFDLNPGPNNEFVWDDYQHLIGR